MILLPQDVRRPKYSRLALFVPCMLPLLLLGGG